MLWLITQRCHKYLFMSIKAEGLLKDRELLENSEETSDSAFKLLLQSQKNV